MFSYLASASNTSVSDIHQVTPHPQQRFHIAQPLSEATNGSDLVAQVIGSACHQLCVPDVLQDWLDGCLTTHTCTSTRTQFR